MTFVLLGYLLYRGSPWAPIGLMGLSTFDRVFEAAVASHLSPSPGRQLELWALALPLWCVYMHAFYVALRVERERRRAA